MGRGHMDQGQRARKEGLRKRMRRLAEVRRCQSCKRGYALRTVRDGDFVAHVCRWCGHEHGGYLTPEEVEG